MSCLDVATMASIDKAHVSYESVSRRRQKSRYIRYFRTPWCSKDCRLPITSDVKRIDC